MEIAIRPGEPRDVEPLVHLWRRFIAEETRAQPDAQPDEFEASWRQRLQEQIATGKVIVAERDDGLTGFVGSINSADRSWVPPHVTYVVDMYVTPEHRQSQAARELFTCLIRQADPQCPEVWTNTHVENRGVQVLLERVGFTPLADSAIEGLGDQLYYRLDTKAVRPSGVR